MRQPLQTISIIIPALNEAAAICEAVRSAAAGSASEVIVVDGGSRDDTVAKARACGARVGTGRPQRAGQMNTGARMARGDILLFLHADTLLPAGFDRSVRKTLRSEDVAAGAFLLGIDAGGFGIRLVEIVANLRSRYLQMPYGDQALFLNRRRFEQLDGFADQPILEDVDLIHRLKAHGRIEIVPQAVRTSPRRWLHLGITRTTLVNWTIMAAYYLGATPERLSHWYRRTKYL